MRRNAITILACALATCFIAAPSACAFQTMQNCLPGGSCTPAEVPANVPADFHVDVRAVARIENLTATGRSLGSGTLVDVAAQQGLVITCAHLFRDGTGRVIVHFPSSTAYEARLLKIDPAADLAALAIQPPPLEAVELATNAPQRGDWLLSGGYGSDGRLWFNRGQVLGYVVTLGSHGRETLELTGSARQGDSGGPVFDRQGALVGVLFGTNGRVVDATYCGRVREFLSGLAARFGTPPGPANEAPADPPAIAPRRPRPEKHPPPQCPERPLDGAIDALEGAARPWLSAKTTAVLISLGVPGGVAALAGAGLVWLAMRRGRRRLESKLAELEQRWERAPAATAPPAATPAEKIIERHHNRYVSYEANSLDKAWASAHARVGEKYPGAVPYLKIVEGVKDQLLSGIDEPQIS